MRVVSFKHHVSMDGLTLISSATNGTNTLVSESVWKTSDLARRKLQESIDTFESLAETELGD